MIRNSPVGISSPDQQRVAYGKVEIWMVSSPRLSGQANGKVACRLSPRCCGASKSRARLLQSVPQLTIPWTAKTSGQVEDCTLPLLHRKSLTVDAAESSDVLGGWAHFEGASLLFRISTRELISKHSTLYSTGMSNHPCLSQVFLGARAVANTVSSIKTQ